MLSPWRWTIANLKSRDEVSHIICCSYSYCVTARTASLFFVL
jgi:hypothetical protein